MSNKTIFEKSGTENQQIGITLNESSDKTLSQFMNNVWTHGFTANLNVVSEFDPNDSSQNIEIWLHKINECAKIYGWNDSQICYYALPKLAGLAQRWYRGLPFLLFSWDEWMVKLRSLFLLLKIMGTYFQKCCNCVVRLDSHYMFIFMKR